MFSHKPHEMTDQADFEESELPGDNEEDLFEEDGDSLPEITDEDLKFESASEKLPLLSLPDYEDDLPDDEDHKKFFTHDDWANSNEPL